MVAVGRGDHMKPRACGPWTPLFVSDGACGGLFLSPTAPEAGLSGVGLILFFTFSVFSFFFSCLTKSGVQGPQALGSYRRRQEEPAAGAVGDKKSGVQGPQALGSCGP